ncbi:hypothetical protein LJC63_12335 [Ruminococcaceae bacterium OttesenSCG-928-L11]|nr:hypothetical protein [Ruminococcaceae bacterium OttesenSCG-928-L11]
MKQLTVKQYLQIKPEMRRIFTQQGEEPPTDEWLFRITRLATWMIILSE